MTLSMFLDTDEDNAAREIDCYGYSLKNAIEYQMKGDFKGSAVHLENAIRSLNELEAMKNMKKMHDKAWLLLKQINSERKMNELKRRLGV